MSFITSDINYRVWVPSLGFLNSFWIGCFLEVSFFLISVSLFHFGNLPSNVWWFLSTGGLFPHPENTRAVLFLLLRGRNHGGWGWGLVHCSERELSVHSLFSSSAAIFPDRSCPGAVSPVPWWCWSGGGGRLEGTSRGGPGPSLSLFSLQPALPTYPFFSPGHSLGCGCLQLWVFSGLWETLQ